MLFKFAIPNHAKLIEVNSAKPLDLKYYFNPSFFPNFTAKLHVMVGGGMNAGNGKRLCTTET